MKRPLPDPSVAKAELFPHCNDLPARTQPTFEAVEPSLEAGDEVLLTTGLPPLLLPTFVQPNPEHTGSIILMRSPQRAVSLLKGKFSPTISTRDTTHRLFGYVAAIGLQRQERHPGAILVLLGRISILSLSDQHPITNQLDAGLRSPILRPSTDRAAQFHGLRQRQADTPVSRARLRR